ncbi:MULTISPECIES: serine hydrolase domain-containing protein [unclassified Mycobacterium]|uniref:serine hydrolase domain-containing protein n=1 Tax=unclassified Mycobacterium TaxID=2642494 RepID=UPI00073FC495|nr:MULTISPECIES: serine hydrolase domain-containing protein [unclassified Mycobacterium]KUH80068.1 serine hydrolase [Mycobacterium sp. GA-0227b]KUH82630.1 serine hydrolase [Mycobacterium sp. GA-1999]
MHNVIDGNWDSRFDKVAEALADEITKGEELGASIAVDIDGESVVDIWGGHADRAKTTPWGRDTIVNFWSCSKTLTALAALMVIDRGQLDPYARVADYWPEFAANGKQDIEVRHLLAHTSGVSGWEAPFGLEDMYDWDSSTSRLAGQALWWPPGTASGYHALNYGHLVGEVIRRVTGKTLKEFVRDEIATPLDADVQIGTAPEDDHRIAELIPPPPLDLPYDLLPQDHPMIKTFGTIRPDQDVASIAETVAWRRADIGGANGHGNARGLARALSPISLGGKANGVQLLAPATIDLIFDEQSNGPDQVLMIPLRFGIGFGLPCPASVPAIPEGNICFWGGWGGSMAVMDVDRRTTLTYVMNRMGPGTTGTERTNRYANLVYEALA